MRRFIAPLLMSLAIGATPAALAEPPRQKVLLVVSGHGQDGGKTRPGFEFDEFAQAYAVFQDNGLTVEVASPQGGKVEADKYDPEKSYNQRALKEFNAAATLASTKPIANVKRDDYAAIFIIGGKGVMFDLPQDMALQKLIADSYENGAAIGAVCHGPAVLANVKLADGSLLIADKAVTGFTNEEEALFGKKWASQFPFQLEDALRAGSKRWAEADIMLPFVQADSRIVTGQNPFSTGLAAEGVVRALGRTPVAREPWSDERSLLLVARFLKGEKDWARRELASSLDKYEAPLIAMYGVYRAKTPNADAATLSSALALMELASPHFQHEQLELAMADTEGKLGRRAEALARVERLLAQKPGLEPAVALQAKLKG